MHSDITRTTKLKINTPKLESRLLKTVLPCLHFSHSVVSLCDTMDYNSPGSSVHGISQARILEWVAISFCMGSSWPRNGTRVSCIASSLLTIWDGSPNALSYSHTIALQFTPTHLFPHLDLHPLLPEFSQEFPIYLSTSSSLSIQPIFHAI